MQAVRSSRQRSTYVLFVSGLVVWVYSSDACAFSYIYIYRAQVFIHLNEATLPPLKRSDATCVALLRGDAGGHNLRAMLTILYRFS